MNADRVFLLFLCAFPALAAASGDEVYRARCATCHDQGLPYTPHREVLRKIPAQRILQTLNTGVMSSVASTLSAEEREAVASWLGTSGGDERIKPEAFCRDRKVTVSDNTGFVWNGWSPSRSNTRFQSAEAAGLTPQQVRTLKLKWAFGFPADLTAFSQPAVFDSQVFAGSSAGGVYAIRAESGCIQWIYQASGPVRSAMVVAPLGNRHAVLFGDQTGWFYATEAESGRLLWRVKVDQHPSARVTGAPVVNEGTVYVPVASWEETAATQPGYACCSSRGAVLALRLRDGKQIWKTYTVSETPKEIGKNLWGPSGGGTWSAPTLDLKRKRLYVTTGNNYSVPATEMTDAVLAMDLATGRVMWSRQITPKDVFSGACGAGACGDERGPDYDFGSSSILVSAGSRDLLIAGQKSGVVSALDPDKRGEIVWQTKIAQGSTHGGVQWGMASDGEKVYAAIADGALRRIALGNGPAVPRMDPNDGGGMAALRVADGSIAWKAAPARACQGIDGCSPSQLAAVSAIPGVVFSGALDGHLRAYSTETGEVLWDFNTLREFQTVNGVRANGGALNGPGAVVVKGMVFVNSGYDHFGSINGNVLLAFSPDGR